VIYLHNEFQFVAHDKLRSFLKIQDYLKNIISRSYHTA